MRTLNPERTTPDRPTEPARRPRRRARLGAVVTAFALVAMLVGLNAAPASASYYGSGSGGAITIYKPEAKRVLTNSGAPVWSNGIALPGVLFHRSPGTTGYQAVDYIIYLQQWNPSTQSWFSPRQTMGFNLKFGAGETWTSPAPHVPTFYNLGGGYYYRILVAAVWKNAYGSTIGSSLYVLDGYDYKCTISNCWTGPGWVYF